MIIDAHLHLPVVKKGTTFEQSKKKLLADTLFEAKVIGWIELFYKVLIAVVIGGFIVHQSMNIYATRREKRSGGHNNERH